MPTATQELPSRDTGTTGTPGDEYRERIGNRVLALHKQKSLDRVATDELLAVSRILYVMGPNAKCSENMLEARRLVGLLLWPLGPAGAPEQRKPQATDAGGTVPFFREDQDVRAA